MKLARLFLATSVSIALAPIIHAEEHNDLVNINVPMSQIGELLESSMPIIYDDGQFADPNNKKNIQQKLADLEKLFREVELHFKRKPVTFKVSADVLHAQINQAQAAFNRDEFSLAQHILKGLPSVCMSCHLQDRKSHKLFNHIDENLIKSDYDRAELSFVMRDYKAALKYYDNFLSDDTSQLEPAKQHQALERMLVLYTEVYKKPNAIYKHLKHYSEQAYIHSHVKKTILAWMSGLEDYMNKSGIGHDGIDYEKLDEYMGQHYKQLGNAWVPVLTSDKDQVFYVLLRASLHEYLNASATQKEIPALLYWLAICDKTLEYHFYYSLSDWYLKECIKVYPDSDYAPRCFQTYKDYVIFSYTGSRGTQLPEDVEQELQALKQYLK